MPLSVLMASHDQTGHVVNHFDYLDLRNIMMSFMTASASLAANDLKGPVTSHFDDFDLRNVIVPCNTDAGTNGITIT